MKTILVIVLIFIGGIQAFGQGIEFFKGDYNAALEKAKQEGKMLFVDFYVDWCGPCKMMAKDVFPQKQVGDYFNAKIRPGIPRTDRSQRFRLRTASRR